MRTAGEAAASAAETAGFARKMRRSATALSSSAVRAAGAGCPSKATIASSTSRPFNEPSVRRAASCTGPFGANPAVSARKATVDASPADSSVRRAATRTSGEPLFAALRAAGRTRLAG